MLQTAETDLIHFIDLARQGTRPGASSGSQRAHVLAEAIAQNAPGMDGRAVDGMIQFIRAAVAYPTTTRDVLQSPHAERPAPAGMPRVATIRSTRQRAACDVVGQEMTE